MSILQTFLDNQARFPSPHSPKTVKELIENWCNREKDVKELHGKWDAVEDRERLPHAWSYFSTVEHSHLYFGTRCFWAEEWLCESGHECLCADPIQESEPEAFLSTSLTRLHPDCNGLSSYSEEKRKPSKHLPLNHSNLGRLPREIHDLIISHLSLKDAISFCSSSRRLSKICDGRFWRSQTIRLHGCWLWELHGTNYFSMDDNWKGLLQLLSMNRSQIQQKAEPYWPSGDWDITEWRNTFLSKNAETGHESSDNAAFIEMPLGLMNRQRIWMCLETLGTKADWEIMEIQRRNSRSTRE